MERSPTYDNSVTSNAIFKIINNNHPVKKGKVKGLTFGDYEHYISEYFELFDDIVGTVDGILFEEIMLNMD